MRRNGVYLKPHKYADKVSLFGLAALAALVAKQDGMTSEQTGLAMESMLGMPLVKARNDKTWQNVIAALSNHVRHGRAVSKRDDLGILRWYPTDSASAELVDFKRTLDRIALWVK